MGGLSCRQCRALLDLRTNLFDTLPCLLLRLLKFKNLALLRADDFMVAFKFIIFGEALKSELVPLVHNTFVYLLQAHQFFNILRITDTLTRLRLSIYAIILAPRFLYHLFFKFTI